MDDMTIMAVLKSAGHTINHVCRTVRREGLALPQHFEQGSETAQLEDDEDVVVVVEEGVEDENVRMAESIRLRCNSISRFSCIMWRSLTSTALNIILIATLKAFFFSRAEYTVPKPPFPSFEPNSKSSRVNDFFGLTSPLCSIERQSDFATVWSSMLLKKKRQRKFVEARQSKFAKAPM
uniref:Uncharacterized protein n=1 Tax=Panagrellus redivivus TaxID=6233 RepID=A0A7E4VQJ7_PANRE